MVIDIAIIAVAIIIAVAGIWAIAARSLLVAVILSGAVSLGASLIFLLMGAPDVAMTEAAIGSGLTTVVFLYALARSKQADDEESDAIFDNPIVEMSCQTKEAQAEERKAASGVPANLSSSEGGRS